MKKRARDMGIPFEGSTGRYNAITDVTGVEVGYSTIVSGNGELVVGKGPVRTGVTAILPRGKRWSACFSGWYALNGNGELTGTTWIEESGFLEGPVLITNTHSAGVVRDSSIGWMYEKGFYDPCSGDSFFLLPVIGETYDGRLNDINGFHVKKENVYEALDSAAGGFVEEGNVGGGMGMTCHEFKGGSGTSSRVLAEEDGGYTVGVFVQANHGKRKNLKIGGVHVGKELTDLMPEIHTTPAPPPGAGSIIVVIATDAPLLPHQLKRLARRAALGIGNIGGMGENSSGDIFVAFSTANDGASNRHENVNVDMLPNDRMNPIFEAVVHATEEAVVNSMIAAETTVGINGNTIHAIPIEQLLEILKRENKLV
ncbi:d-aminopeptidase (plasmid) [Peptoclostridium acidaminophilum DSM 3953]|uniref:D-aminopeptidase n=1 Tax=Peptoclostridium acidaminophilum DSM 3953 TaxID=1286171 RepID=W8TBI0_PEPAC|nr:P1 family peptidase [Peptoclostridium acidaminophilum]AHM58180.1 d-aminopeptidase [Peptoclostridium acidaminophilum DSM 3953]